MYYYLRILQLIWHIAYDYVYKYDLAFVNPQGFKF